MNNVILRYAQAGRRLQSSMEQQPPVQPFERAMIEQVLQYDIPVLHPLAVHFPMALLLAAALSAVLWSVRGTGFWRRCTLWLLTLGMGGALFAYFTGDALEEQVEGTPIVEELVGFHEDMALYTLIVAGVALLALAGLSVWLERRITLERDVPDPIVARVAITVFVVAAAVLVAWTGHIGGVMVWGQ